MTADTEALAERLGPYRLIQRIGEGGMGVVHLALDPHGRAVAVKVLRPHVAHDPEARARLEREVATLARIRHPRVAPVIDCDLSGTRPYIVTRFVAGDALDDRVDAHGPLPPADLLTLARGLHGAIEAIHAVGVVHRDLKPGNVLLDDDDGEPVVIDFGIAHVAEDARLTATGLVMGTPGYLSPEVIEGAAVTPATDWWGWAATLAFAATGRPPFGRGSMNIVLTRVRAGNCDLDGIDPRLEPLLAAALSPRPEDRPPAQLVMAALERYAAGGFATDVLPVQHGIPSGSSGAGVAAGSTGGPRHTAVMPMQPPTGEPYALPHPVRQGSGAVPPSTPWAMPPGVSPRVPPAMPPTVPPAMSPGVAPTATPARPSAAPAAEAPDDPNAPGSPDPRIGRPDRTGTIALGALFLAALAASLPVVAVLVLVGWSVLARTADRSVTSIVLRRFERGWRRGDVPWAVARGPWHAVLAAATTAVALMLPVLVGIAGMFCVALGLAAVTGSAPAPAHPMALAGGMALALLLAWWGPGGASMRRGSRSLIRGLARPGMGTTIVGTALGLGGLAALVWLVLHSGAPSWTPLSGPPGLLLSWR